MDKKVSYFIFLILGLAFVVSVTNLKINENKVNDDIIQDTTIEQNDKDKTNDNELITLDNLVFDQDVKIENLVQINNNYYAYGSKNGFPYLQLVSNSTEINTNFNEIEGGVVDLTDNNGYLSASILKSDGTITEQDFFVSKNEIIPYYKKQLEINYYKGVIIEPEYIVIHETANTNVGADADAHFRYWSTNQSAYASAHYVVDSTQIYQMLELNQAAWHVGDNKGYSDITNMNTIGIEISVNSDGNYELARQFSIDLTIKIMKELNMDINQLKMHNDASGKLDPVTMLNNPDLWEDFVSQVEEGLRN